MQRAIGSVTAGDFRALQLLSLVRDSGLPQARTAGIFLTSMRTTAKRLLLAAGEELKPPTVEETREAVAAEAAGETDAPDADDTTLTDYEELNALRGFSPMLGVTPDRG